MTVWHVALLGLVQGLTEFLPVSSSGHLVLLEFFLTDGDMSEGALLQCLLHLGTLLPVLWLFRDQVRRQVRLVLTPSRWRAPATPDEDWDLARFLLLGTLTTLVLGLPTLKLLESLFQSPLVVAAGLLATTALLLASRFLPEPPPGRLTVRQGLLVGLAQGFAIVPGISRSGATLVMGLLVGIPRERLGACSMLLSVPPILGGVVLEGLRHGDDGPGIVPGLVGLLLAAGSGYFAVRWVLALLQRRRLAWFAPYTFLLAMGVWWVVH